jgi:nucleotide-binding universal stress UspA family protein
MKTLQSILLATDFRPASQAAAQAAARLASVFGSRVTALHVLAPMPEWPVALHVLTERAEDALQAVRRELSASGVIVTEALIEVGPPADTIVRKAQALGADLIVIGAGEWSAFDRFTAGPVAESVLHHASLPVLAVRPGEPAVAFQTILCPVDHSRASRRGLENAIRLARACGGRLVVLSVVPEASWLTAAVETGKLAGASEEYDRNWRAEFEQMLAEIEFGDVPWEREVRTGRVHEAINLAARDHHADLIVMGSIGRTGLARVLLGSVTRRMLQHLPCSLLVVRDQDLLGELHEDELRTIRGLLAEGRALLAADSPAAALVKFREVLAHHPYDAAALEGQAEACAALGQAEEAARCRRRAEAIRNPT